MLTGALSSAVPPACTRTHALLGCPVHLCVFTLYHQPLALVTLKPIFEPPLETDFVPITLQFYSGGIQEIDTSSIVAPGQVIDYPIVSVGILTSLLPRLCLCSFKGGVTLGLFLLCPGPLRSVQEDFREEKGSGDALWLHLSMLHWWDAYRVVRVQEDERCHEPNRRITYS